MIYVIAGLALAIGFFVLGYILGFFNGVDSVPTKATIADTPKDDPRECGNSPKEAPATVKKGEKP